MIKPLGDKGIIVYFENLISEEILSKVHSLKKHIQVEEINGIEEFVPSYNALTIYYDPSKIKYNNLKTKIQEMLNKPIEKSMAGKIIKIPVLYNGPDLKEVSEYTKLSIKEIIKLHTSPIYIVYMIGFSPGFPYLGGLDKQLATPRRKKPRIKIEAGSVGIANEQTGIYSVDSPGGWQIIGKTPIKLFNIEDEKSVLLSSNMRLQFYEISEEEFMNWEGPND